MGAWMGSQNQAVPANDAAEQHPHMLWLHVQDGGAAGAEQE